MRHFSIDSLAVRNGRVFGWGWFLDTEYRMVRGELLLTLEDGSEIAIPCLDGAARSDVAAAFPQVEHAATCGFMLMASLPGPVDPARGGRFTAELADGTRHVVQLATLPVAPPPPPPPGWRERWTSRLRRWATADAPSRIGPALAARRERLREARHLQDAQHSATRTALVFDHDMGGGANAYRERLLGLLLVTENRVALVTPQLASLDYEIRLIESGGEVARWREPDDASLLTALARLNIATVDVNNLVGFTDPLRIVDWCVERRRRGATLAFHLHDFHSVCPAFTLIDAEGRYCGVPALDACRACLPRNAANSLGLGQRVDPAAWREAWSRLLASADRIVAFSDASARILERAYPELHAAARLEVRPHAIEHQHLRRVRPGGGDILKVGVIGNISRPKGAEIVAGIAARARADGLALQIVVIGTLQASVPPGPHLIVHGPFDPSELPDLVERYGIDVCLMPSVCPETYSFVTDEIMAMGLPLAVFDIGAPAERVARYALGEVVASITADDALAGIIRLARRAMGTTADEQEYSRG